MPCIPEHEFHSLSALTRQASEIDAQPGLGWQTILSFTAILFAGMQGTLAMESADPCRMSFEKVLFLLGLELLEMLVVIAAEFYSFFELRSALQTRLQWLGWVPYCLLLYGIVGLAMDVSFTVYLAHRSRVRWIPFSNIQYHENAATRIVAIVHLVITTGFSIVLVGWRQRWFMKASSGVSTEEAINAASGELSLSIGAMIFCLAWAISLLIISVVLCFSFRKELLGLVSALNIVRRKWPRRLKPFSRGKKRNDTGDEKQEPDPANNDNEKDEDDDDDDDDEEGVPSNSHDIQLQNACIREDLKVFRRNPWNYLERILYPDKYESCYRRENNDEYEELVVRNRCRLLMLLKTDNKMQKKKAKNGNSYFRVEIRKSRPEAQESNGRNDIETITSDEEENEIKQILKQMNVTIDGEFGDEVNETQVRGDKKGSSENSRVVSLHFVTEMKRLIQQLLIQEFEEDEECEASQQETSVVQKSKKCVDLIENCKDLDRVVQIYMQKSPLHVRNAIISDRPNDNCIVCSHGDGKSTALHIVLLIAVHISLLPLLICVVVAVIQLWDKLDSETFRALKELADTVIVISVVEIALNLKQILWAKRCINEADIPDYEKSSDSSET